LQPSIQRLWREKKRLIYQEPEFYVALFQRTYCDESSMKRINKEFKVALADETKYRALGFVRTGIKAWRIAGEIL